MTVTRAPDWDVRGPGSGRLTLCNWVARDEDDEGGRLWRLDRETGVLGSLGPATPSDDGDVSHGHPAGSPTGDTPCWREGDTPTELLLGASTSLSSVESEPLELDSPAVVDEDGGGCGNSSMAVALCLDQNKLTSATSEW